MATVKLFENDSYIKEFTATVISCEEKDGVYFTVLDKTAFFPEGGGQPADKGKINDADVLDVQIKNEIIYHKVNKPFNENEKVNCVLDWDTRFSRMQNHTGEHIVSGVIHTLFGYNNVGFHLNDTIVTLDVDGALTDEDIKKVELVSNKAIYDNKTVRAIYPAPEELPSYDYRSKLDITEGVRLIEIEDYDLCACCAPHVARTGEIGIIKIISAVPYKKGTRIEMLCGYLAFNDYCSLHTSNKSMMNLLSAKRFNVFGTVEKIYNEVNQLKYENKRLASQLAMASLEMHVVENKTCVFIDNATYDDLRSCSNDLIEEHEICCLFSNTDTNNYIYVVSSKTLNVRELVQGINQAFNGKGGGRDTYAQGKITANSKEEILNYFKK